MYIKKIIKFNNIKNITLIYLIIYKTFNSYYFFKFLPNNFIYIFI